VEKVSSQTFPEGKDIASANPSKSLKSTKKEVKGMKNNQQTFRPKARRIHF